MFDDFLALWGERCVILAVWIVLVLSLNLINGYCGLFSLGHQGFWMAGAYAAGALMKYLPHAPGPNWVGFFLSFPLAFVVAALFGLLVGVPCLRLKGDYLAIATLGFSEILRNIVQNSEWLGRSDALKFREHSISMALSKDMKYIVFLVLSWGTVALVTILLRNLMRSSHGRAIQAIRDDERAAELLGVNLTRYKVFVFVTGAGLAGLAGAIFANFTANITIKDFDFNRGVLIVVMVVFGGMGSSAGTFAATTILYFFPILLASVLPDTGIPVFYDPSIEVGSKIVYSDLKSLWQVFFAILLIVVVLVRPQGILKGVEFKLPWKRKKTGAGG